MPHISTLDEVSRQNLERILATDVRALTPEDVSFLKARRDYLTGEQLHNLGPILEETEQIPREDSVLPPSAEPTEAPKRKGVKKTEAHE